MKRRIPTITRNVSANQYYNKFARLLLESSSNPKVLILGGSILGEAMESLLSYGQLELIETDVSFGPRTKLICDAHDIPFVEAFFDGVVVQAVLEHVVDPYRCVDEIHRVLKEGGFVRADTPFMQQVHGRQYDFTRFTHLGHRRLFRKFEEIASGVSCGPSVALAWACEYFLLSFAQTHFVRHLLRLATRISLSPLKYVDYYLVNKPGALDAASAYYFLGRKSRRILSDRELIRLYRGAS